MSIKSEIFINNYSAVIPAAVAGVPGQVDLFAITVPAKAVLKVLAFGNYTDTVAAWTFVNWIFYLDNLLLYPYNAIFDQMGFGTEKQRIQGIEITGGHVLRIQANNWTAGTPRMGISLEYEMVYFEQ